MKLIIKLVLIFFLGVQSLTGYSQVNLNDIYQTGSTWSELYSKHSGQIGLQNIANYYFTIGSDTVINSDNYKKLTLVMKFIGSQNVIDLGTIGGIRVNSRQVYFIRTKTLPDLMSGIDYQSLTINSLPLLIETTLYDFNLVQGTTLSWKPTNPTVIAVGAVVVNGITLSTYQFWNSSPFHETWKEGIGSEQGFFGSYRTFHYNERFVPTCFYSPGFRYPANCSVPLISGVKENSVEEAVTIYPNPLVSEILNIAIPEKFKIQRVEVYNALGKVVFQENYYANPSQISLNVTPGIYSVKFRTDNEKTFTRRISKL